MIPHESAVYHVSGEAVYVDDMSVDGLLHGRVVYSPHAHANIKTFDLRKARKLPGVYAVLCHKNIAGINDMGPVHRDEPILADGMANFIGQAVFLIAAENEEIAREAEKLIRIKYEPLDAIVTLEDAMRRGRLIQPERKIECGDVVTALAEAKHVLEGTLHTGAQEHWYLETQCALAVPGEGNEITIHSSTQNPSETQCIIAHALGINKSEVEVICRRMGGAFGGKETQANHTAVWTVLLARAAERPVKIRLFRDDDQIMTGKRHRFVIQYKVGFDDDGLIHAIDTVLNSDAGATTDLSMAVLERAMMHSENAYYIPNMRIRGRAWFTNLPSNTAFRGFGGPQGMAGMEDIIDRVARYLRKDPAEIRYKNFYGINDRHTTPYGQKVENNRLFVLWDQLMQSSEYGKRRKNIDAFNVKNEFLKKGIAISPVKFGISFTTSFLNQAGALVNVYKDGTVLVNHGGTEMGQGLYTKILQIAAMEFGISNDRVKVNATATSKVPNTSATAASAGTDLNGMAVKNAIGKLKKRIAEVVAGEFNKKAVEALIPVSARIASHTYNGDPTQQENIVFDKNAIYDAKHPERSIPFADAIPLCIFNQVGLSATGFYRTPDIYFDRKKGKGQPYYYFAFGMAVTEVLVDTLTGYVKILRTDILHDAGESLNPRIDIGQVEGGYIQGVGWVTTEECNWDERGNLLNHSPDTYKIPSVQDIPDDFRVQLLQGYPNTAHTIRRSKAVAEPPLMLALSCWLAIKDAVSAVGNHKTEPEFRIPASNEVIVLAAEKLRKN